MSDSNEKSPSTGWKRVAELMDAEDGAGPEAAEYVNNNMESLLPSDTTAKDRDELTAKEIMERMIERIEESA